MRSNYPVHGRSQSFRLAQRPATANATGFVALLLTFAFIVEGFVAKSFIFSGNDPILVHYIASVGICACLVLYFGFVVGLRNVSPYDLVLILAAFCWSLLSSLVDGLMENLIGSFTFALALLTCFIVVPRVMHHSGYNLEKLIERVLIVFVIFSAVLWAVLPSYAIDPQSGRFSGAAISVAVACNLLFYASVLFAFATRAATSVSGKSFYGVMTALAFAMLYMTYTRSSLAQALFCLLIVLFTDKRGHLNVRSVFIAFWLLLVALFFALAYYIFVGVDIDQIMVNLRLADGASVTDTRFLNWDFAMQRIADSPWFGEGMLTKQTAGGAAVLDLADSNNYSVLYDPHSLVLSLGVQAGIPFALIMSSFFVFVFLRHVFYKGVAASLSSTYFVLAGVNLFVMIFSGGDLTSMGSLVDRLSLVFLGIVGFAHFIGREAVPSGKLWTARQNGRIFVQAGHPQHQPLPGRGWQ